MMHEKEEIIMEEWKQEQIEQNCKDTELLEKIKCCVSEDVFSEIEFQLEESENPSNYRIVNEPVGTPQNEGAYNIWIVQTGGETGDNYNGTVCMELDIGKYLMFDYWM